MNTRRTPLIIGIVLALGTGLLLLNYLAQSRGPTVGMKRVVLVTTREIAARSTVTADMVNVESRIADQVDANAISDPRKIAGNVALITIPAGSILTASQVVKPASLSLPTRLQHGLRAVSIAIDRVKGVSGLLQPGDRVDVIAVQQRAGDETPRAMTIMRGVLVLALGNEMETASATPAPDNQNLTTVTLAVNPQQANLIALADVYTTLRLALRSSNEPLRSYPVEPIPLGTTVRNQPVALAPVADRGVESRSAVPAPAPPAAREKTTPATKVAAVPYVEVIEGDRASTRPDGTR